MILYTWKDYEGEYSKVRYIINGKIILRSIARATEKSAFGVKIFYWNVYNIYVAGELTYQGSSNSLITAKLKCEEELLIHDHKLICSRLLNFL